MSAFGAATTSKQDMIQKKKKKIQACWPPWRPGERKVLQHALSSLEASIILLAREWPHGRAGACIYFPVSEQRSLVWDQARTEGRCGLPSGVYHWLLCSPHLGDKNKLRPMGPRSCGWQFENIWKTKGFCKTQLRWSFLAQKEKVWLSLLKGFFVWQSHALFASAPITVRSGKMSCSYPSSIPDG